MRAALDDPAVLEHQDEVGVADRRQAVGDHQRRAAFQGHRQRVLHRRLRRRVEAGRRLVEDHDPRLGEQQPGDRQPLALAAREAVAALADDGAETVRQRGDQAVEADLAEHVPQVGVGRRRIGVAQVLAHRVVEQVAVLGDDTDRRTQVVEPEIAHVDATDPDACRRRRRRAVGSARRSSTCRSPTSRPAPRPDPATTVSDTSRSTTSPPRVSSVATSSSEASDTLSAAG